MIERIDKADWRIAPARRGGQAEVLDLVFSHLPRGQRFSHTRKLVAAARAGRSTLDGLFESRREGRVIGAVFAQVQPGRVAGLWPPRTTDPSAVCCADELAARAVQWIDQQDVRLAQSLVACDAAEDECRLERVGFEPYADLLYMQCSRGRFAEEQPATELAFVPFQDAHASRMAAVVDRTYVGTLDCPRLGNLRSVDDMLEGCRMIGDFAPERWLFVQHQGNDVGCVLVADHPAEQQWEVLYLGVVPEARGRGFGRAITDHVQWLARQAGRQRIVLAVDAANEPALEIYTQAGFWAWERRRAMVRLVLR